MRTILKSIRAFVGDKSGAVTVDWVALTAAVVVIGIGLVYAVFGTGNDGVAGLVDNLTGELNTAATNIQGQVGTFPSAGGGTGGTGGTTTP